MIKASLVQVYFLHVMWSMLGVESYGGAVDKSARLLKEVLGLNVSEIFQIPSSSRRVVLLFKMILNV